MRIKSITLLLGLILSISFIAFSTPVAADDDIPIYEQRAQAITNSYNENKWNVNPVGDYVACNFWRSFGTGRSRRRFSQTFTVPKNICEAWVEDTSSAGNPMISGDYVLSVLDDTGSTPDIWFQVSAGDGEFRLIDRAIANKWKSETIQFTNPIFATEFYRSRGTNNYPNEAFRVATPPNCPFEINKLELISDFCLCGEKVVRTDKGGLCDYNTTKGQSLSPKEFSLNSCDSDFKCGDNYIKALSTDQGFSKDIDDHYFKVDFSSNKFMDSTSSDLMSSDARGIILFYTYLYVNESFTNLSIRPYIRPGDTVHMHLHPIIVNQEGQWVQQTAILDKVSGNNQISENFNVREGWYLFKIEYKSGITTFQKRLRLDLFQNSQPINIGDVFKTANTFGIMPVPTDPTEDGLCINGYGFEVQGTHYKEGLGCCGYLGIKSIGTEADGGNLGLIANDSEDNYYVCLKNRADGDAIRYAETSTYVWRPAHLLPYYIMSAFIPEDSTTNPISQTSNATHFVSSGEQWFMCNASGLQVLNPSYSLAENETFPSPPGSFIDPNDPLCLSVLQYSFGNVGSCNTEGECEEQEFSAFCFGINQPTYDSGNFVEDCSNNCRILHANQYVNLEQYFDLSNPTTTFCESPAMRDEPICRSEDDGSIPGWCINPDFRDNSLCRGEGFDITKTCQAIQTTEAQSSFNEDYNVCEENQYCTDGAFFNNTRGEMCCIGAAARCRDLSELTCQQIQGTEFNSETHICPGNTVEVGGESNCCIGGEPSPRADIPVYALINESFICYQQQGNNYIKECCAGPGCRQSSFTAPANPLKDLGLHSLTKVYTTTGGTLYDLVRFENLSDLTNRPIEGGNVLSFLLPQDIILSNWSDFSELRFVLLSNIPKNLSIIIENSGVEVLNQSLTEYYVRLINSGISAEVRVNLSSIDDDLTNVTRVRIKNNVDDVRANVVATNFYLVPNPESTINSELRYCTGRHRIWIDNLDGGDSPKGFWGEDVNDEDKIPYEVACNAQLTNRWTGNVCCGNNPEGTGEFFIDSIGMCWNSTSVRNHQVVKNEIGLVDPTNITRRLLFSNGKMYGCNISADNASIKMRMNFGPDNQGENYLTYEEFFEEKELFETMAGHVCMPDDGWVRLQDSNRMLIIASHLLTLAGNQDYTLYCGNINDLKNYLPTNIDGFTSNFAQTQLSACILRKETSGEPEETYVGLEVALPLNLDDYSDAIIKPFFEPFPEFDDIDIICNNPVQGAIYGSCTGFNNNYMRMYGSQDLRIILLSTEQITVAGLVDVTVWQRFRNWLTNLFTINLPSATVLPDFGVASRYVTDFYITTIEGKNVTGVVSGRDEQRATRITLKGLNPRLGTIELLNLFGVLSDDELDACFVEVKSDDEVDIVIPGSFSNWKRTTGILRLQSQPQGDSFMNSRIYSCDEFISESTNLFAPTSQPVSVPNNPGTLTNPNTVYFEGFESATVNQNFFGSNFLTVKNNDDNNYLQVRYRPTRIGSPRIFDSVRLEPSQEYTLKYHVFFDEDFEFVRGGKLPGLTSRHPIWGCTQNTVDHGWSARVMWRANGVPEIYYYDNDRQGGQCGKSERATNFQFQKGRWHEISLRVKVNDNGQSNGEVDLKIDNNLVASVNNVRFRAENTDRSLINLFYFNTFFGGGSPEWSPTKEVYAYFDNFLVHS